jgi:hypothetical protein
LERLLDMLGIGCQHTPVLQTWSFALLDGEMAVNVCAPSLCECPGKRLDDNLDRIKRTDLNRIGWLNDQGS